MAGIPLLPAVVAREDRSANHTAVAGGIAGQHAHARIGAIAGVVAGQHRDAASPPALALLLPVSTPTPRACPFAELLPVRTPTAATPLALLLPFRTPRPRPYSALGGVVAGEDGDADRRTVAGVVASQDADVGDAVAVGGIHADRPPIWTPGQEADRRKPGDRRLHGARHRLHALLVQRRRGSVPACRLRSRPADCPG